MCEPYDPFDFPDLPDEAVVAIDNFLTEFLTRFQDHYFDQMHRTTTTGPRKTPTTRR